MKFNKLFYKSFNFWLGFIMFLGGISLFPAVAPNNPVFSNWWWINLAEFLFGLSLLIEGLIQKPKNSRK
ncbi:hypothetical protein [Lentilactobacillus kefiri]|uniref:hypothetical protein n=1 Tax=Lentilactobacillus kefiri TaxID=33962 RepID=UPI0006D29876|nr:hypothetical protein [Lentilactobacillus kefiri]MCJ2161565.1 hypothetical protein [Lentilactobacillus kefiri]MCP9368154.1 hypothetical protein [Lentilactobacillus kefiri]MDH5108220.1 hypothetical protein [Lentilactobacillus kefiri]MDM7492622.1 hypothetical protein [Lentilactobacillus kefiri]PAK59880.1 hypothetical protein B9K02_03780 [Lentilactobacillus kefiri]